MIAQGLTIGISKRALLEDYYPDEIQAVFAAWGDIHGAERAHEPERVDVTDFLAM